MGSRVRPRSFLSDSFQALQTGRVRPGARRARRAGRTPTAFRPRLERLEDRLAFAAVVHVELPFQETGEVAGVEYDISVPEQWNGTLLVLARGGGDAPDHPSEFPFAEFQDDPIPTAIPHIQGLLQEGYAVASAGYSQLGWQVESGIQDIKNVRSFFYDRVGVPERDVMLGISLGSMPAEQIAERGTGGFDGAVLYSGFGTGALNVVDRMLATRLAYDVLFADEGGFRPEWGTIADVRDAFDPDNEVYPLDFEFEVAPVLLPQFFDLDPDTGEPVEINQENFGKWEFMRLVLGQPEDGLNQQFGLPDGTIVPAFPFIPMFWATEFAQTIERRAGGAPAQNLDHVYDLAQQDKDYLSSLGIDADTLLDEMNARRVYDAVDNDARAYLGQFFTPSGEIKIPVLAEHQSNDVNIPVHHRNYYEQLVDNAGRGHNLVQVYVNPVGGHGAESPQQVLATVNAMDSWLRTGVRPDPADNAVFPAEAGFDPDFEPGPYPLTSPPDPRRPNPRGAPTASGEASAWANGWAASSWSFADPSQAAAPVDLGISQDSAERPVASGTFPFLHTLEHASLERRMQDAIVPRRSASLLDSNSLVHPLMRPLPATGAIGKNDAAEPLRSTTARPVEALRDAAFASLHREDIVEDGPVIDTLASDTLLAGRERYMDEWNFDFAGSTTSGESPNS